MAYRNSYSSRMIRAGISRHAPHLPPLPQPTTADLQSHVFRQTWRAAHGASSITFNVLALDADHAATLGGIQLAATGEDARASVLAVNEQVPPSFDLVVSILRGEDTEVWAARQDEWTRRDNAEPTHHQTYNGPGLEGGVRER